MGLRLRALQESRRWILGAILALEALDRLMLVLAAHAMVFQATPLPTSLPLGLVDGFWVKIAYPTGESQVDGQGRRRAAKRQQTRVVLNALGGAPEQTD